MLVDPSMFFDGWRSLGRVALIGTLGYLALIVLLRTSGKRTLSKMNAFDFVVTVALGSTLASMLLSKSVTLADGALALAVLVALQYVIAWLCVRSKVVSRLVKSEPALLFYRGSFLHDAMRRERVVEEEIQAAIRNQGVGTTDVDAVVLETDGTFSVIRQVDEGSSVLEGVSNVPPTEP